MMYGWGKWLLVEKVIPTRTALQIKSHAQKYRARHPIECELMQKDHLQRVAMAAPAEKPKRKEATTARGRRTSKSAIKAKTPATLRHSRPSHVVGAGRSSVNAPSLRAPTKTSPKAPGAEDGICGKQAQELNLIDLSNLVIKTAFGIKHALGVFGKPVSSNSLLQRADRHMTTEDARAEDAGAAAAALVSMAGGR